MELLAKHPTGCPSLQLAPMEGVGDASFRRALATVGGFDEAVRDFLRVPRNAHVKSLAAVYNAKELAPIALAAQLMGADPELMAEMAKEIEARGAPRIDINCGCPSDTVTGRGAGSSLLKNPHFLFDVAHAVVKAVTLPVTLKMRSGFEDTSLFDENVQAAQESGVKYITIHPRTKSDGYAPPAKWEYIARAKSLLKIPVVGNGDILNVNDALKMLSQTNCDGLMIGRGALINPFLFHEIKAHFSGIPYTGSHEKLEKYLEVYLHSFPETMPLKNKVNKLKQLLGFIFKGSPALLGKREHLLRSTSIEPKNFLTFALSLLPTGTDR